MVAYRRVWIGAGIVCFVALLLSMFDFLGPPPQVSHLSPMHVTLHRMRVLRDTLGDYKVMYGRFPAPPTVQDRGVVRVNVLSNAEVIYRTVTLCPAATELSGDAGEEGSHWSTDANGNGDPEIVDGWGHPFLYYAGSADVDMILNYRFGWTRLKLDLDIKNSFLLCSAGADNVFGTKDDLLLTGTLATSTRGRR